MLKIFPFFIGWRYFRADSSTNLISFISLMAISGLTLGVALLILVMSIMNGFERELEGKILGSIPHIQISKTNGIDNLSGLIDLIEKDKNVVSALPFSQIDAMLTSNGNAMPVQMLGIDILKSNDFIDNFVAADLIELIRNDDNKFLLAKGVANRLSLQAGDNVVLIVPQSNHVENTKLTPKIISFEIGGVFATKTSLDQKLVLGPLSKVTDIIGLSHPQGIRVKLANIFHARETGYRLLNSLPENYYFSDWIQTHGNLHQAIKMSRKMIILLVFFVIAIAVFNVVSMLMMTVVDKHSDIAILKTQGARNSDITMIFLTQGFLIGTIGSVLGAALGILGSLNAPFIINKIESIFEFSLLDSSVYPIDYLPSSLVWSDVFLVVSVAIILNLLVTIYPSLKAAKLSPANELKYD
jgi:lipoprotein-releasing system permease protein